MCRDSQVQECALELLNQFPPTTLRAALTADEWTAACDAALDPGDSAVPNPQGLYIEAGTAAANGRPSGSDLAAASGGCVPCA